MSFDPNEALVQPTDDILRSRMWGLRWLAAGLVVVFIAEWVGGRDDLGIASLVVAVAWATAELLWWVSQRQRPGTQGFESELRRAEPDAAADGRRHVGF